MNNLSARLNQLDLDQFGTWITIRTADWTSEHLRLVFHIQATTWDGASVQEEWQVMAGGVVEHRIELGQDCMPEENTDSPRLIVAQTPTVRLMFASPPKDQSGLVADLRAVHDETGWDRFGTYGLGGDLSFGTGVFAEGPLPLMQAYQGVLETHGMRPTQLWLRQPRTPPAVCLELGGTVWRDDRYVLALTLIAHKL